MTKVLINEHLVDEQDARVPYNDRGYVFGDGIYEYIRTYNNNIFTAKPHFERLLRSAKEIGLDLKYNVDELTELVQELLAANGVVNGGVYIQVTRGAAPRDHAFPTPSVEANVMAFTKTYERPYKLLEEGINAITIEDIRWLRCDIKSLNLLGNVLAKESAVKYNAQEAIQHRGDIVTEGSSSNVYAIKGGEIYTHPVNNYILNGITRMVIKDIAEAKGIPFNEGTFTVDFLRNADEIIVSSTSIEVMPVIKLDGEFVGEGKVGPITKSLQEGFNRYIDADS
ncbi:D-amino-acid transaminase [Staphylococcus nepalensis]|uniref:D-alanine aminotransferase n=1 Tax=Staphylococcus nepalensis TaxID=214473 RepID=A0A2T4SBN9_9STAP|nr:D-amino-acid transaminase [Staphylococcus nepalensis]VDG66788.1 branched-chain amino acid aminotransferase/4-amino-4-deoxychorismate lyase [Lacrimispora indolis]MBO1205249.1 D-amino-acid transaminase [Staphylococcus nepalensis]MBO1213205.1 D-amino-acid transaminase [Staphylococcus nepalensis]MBO1215573.1 D-amino-acid transaminase [Staphylococcus nepalensis]MBO1221638.1 D-amino-acid transaminase [Staphylococcus nepalensis]